MPIREIESLLIINIYLYGLKRGPTYIKYNFRTLNSSSRPMQRTNNICSDRIDLCALVDDSFKI